MRFVYTVMQSVVMACMIGAMTLAATGCGSDTAGIDSAQRQNDVFWSLDVSHHAATLSTVAPYDTLPLVITPRALNGVALTLDTPPTFQIGDGTDTSIVVTTDGQLVAHSYTHRTLVTITVKVGDVTRKDTILVTVDTTIPADVTQPLSSFAFDGNDVGLVATCGEFAPSPTLTVIDADGNYVAEPTVVYSSSNGNIVSIDRLTGAVTPNCAGSGIGVPVWLRATATVLGVTYTDSIKYATTIPTIARTRIVATTVDDQESIVFDNPLITIAAGGAVYWFYFPESFGGPMRETGITFDTPDLVEATTDTIVYLFIRVPPSEVGGNIPEWTPDRTLPLTEPDENGFFGPGLFGTKNARIRRFPTPGTYHYHSTRYPSATGTITVVAVPTP